MRRCYRIEWDALDGSSGDEVVMADDAGAAFGLVLDEHELDDQEVVFTIEPIIDTAEPVVADNIVGDVCDLAVMPREVLNAVLLAGELGRLRPSDPSTAKPALATAAAAGRRRKR